MSKEENYWKLVDSVLEKISFDTSTEKFFEQFNKLSAPEQNLFAAHCCYSEVVNGGFYQFFANPSGILAPESVKGFQAVDLSNCAELISKAITIFGADFPRHEEQRNELLDSFANLNEGQWNPFEKLDDEIYECLEIASNNFLFEQKAELYAKNFFGE